MKSLGIKTVIYTDVARDGMLTGPNVEGIAGMVKKTEMEIIASGGMGTLDDVYKLKGNGRRRRDNRQGAVYRRHRFKAGNKRGGGNMLTKRIIPCLDVHAGRVVKGINFVDIRDAGDPVEMAKAFNEAGADELVFLDITASADERSIMSDVVAKTAEQVFIPLTVGGGIRTLEDFREILNRGADKISSIRRR